jgi:hypothetical protein
MLGFRGKSDGEDGIDSATLRAPPDAGGIACSPDGSPNGFSPHPASLEGRLKWRRGWDSKSPFTVFFICFMALNRLCVCLPQPLLSWLSQHRKPNTAKAHRKKNLNLRENSAITVRPHVRDEPSTGLTQHSPLLIHPGMSEPVQHNIGLHWTNKP